MVGGGGPAGPIPGLPGSNCLQTCRTLHVWEGERGKGGLQNDINITFTFKRESKPFRLNVLEQR